MTLSLITSGAVVIEYPAAPDATMRFQIGRPVFASMAIRCASTVARKSVSPRIARPRVMRPQQNLASDGRRVRIDPEDLSGRRIERDDVVALRRVHDSVDDQRRRLVVVEPSSLEHPLQLEILDVCRRDLRELAVALAHVAAGIRQPVLRFLLRVQEPIRGHLGEQELARARERRPARIGKRGSSLGDDSFQRAQIGDDVGEFLGRERAFDTTALAIPRRSRARAGPLSGSVRS